MPTAGARAAHRERVHAALDLHAAGLDPRMIAVRLNTTVERATRWLTEGMRSLPAQEVDDLRITSELRLNRLAAVYGELLEDEDPKVRLQAANGLRSVEDSRARLLGTWQKPPKDEG